MLQQALTPRLHLFRIKYTQRMEHCLVLLCRQPLDGVDTGGDDGEVESSRALGPIRGVAVSVEHHFDVVFEEGLRHGDRRLAALHSVRDLLELRCHHGREDGVDEGDVLGGAHGAELEAVAAVGEGAGPVAVLRGRGDEREVVDAEVDVGAAGRVGRDVPVHEAGEVAGEVLAEVGGDDGGGGLHAAEAEVVAGRGNGGAH
mmetsp:Transcript_10287/g.18589  ORF Transcript_10287/g.18589 Transcript_10287/m.18589 type:complete len:201 (-) Transcript_10287:1482-2084(-)